MNNRLHNDLTDRSAPPVPTLPWENPLRGALALVRARPRLWLLLALPGVVSGGLDLIVAAAFPDTPYMRGMMQRMVGPPLGILAALCWLAMTSAMSMLVVGVPVSTVRDAFARPAYRIQPLVGLGCLVGVAVVPILMVVLVVATRATGLGAPSGFFQPPIYIAATVGIWLIGTRLGFAPDSVLLTMRGPLAALQHSWALTRGHVLRLLPYTALISGPSLGWAVYRIMPIDLNGLSDERLVPSASMPPEPPELAQSLVALVGRPLWLVYGTALGLLLWYRLRADEERFTLAAAAREIAVRSPKP